MLILVIEDEKKVANFIRQGLKEEHYVVEIASDGVAGLELALSKEYDAIVLDVMLPKKNGYDIVRELRAAKKYTPVLMLTAKNEITDKVEGLDAGADDYLAKPFVFEELTARLRSLLRRASSNEKTATLKAADLTLDLVKHSAFRPRPDGADGLIGLTSKEYELLEYLIRNKNRVLSRSSIMQHVWGYSFDTESNIIDVYMTRLRQKVDGDRTEKEKLLHSIRGVGYTLRDDGVIVKGS